MPKTRSASLRAAHSRSCPNASKTALDSTDRGSGCTCKPSYYTLHRDSAGKVVKGERVRDRQVADRALRALQVKIDEGRTDLRRREPITFDEWADERMAHIEEFGRKPSTVRAYDSTLKVARPILGQLDLADIGGTELRRVVRKIREGGAGDTTVRKHLKHLSTFFLSAVEEEHIDRSPLGKKFVADLRLAKPAKGTPPFTDVELAKLIGQMRALDYEDVYIAAVRFAATTGLRIGEIVGLEWGDVNLTSKTIRVARTWDPLAGPVAPKDTDARTVHLIPAAVKILEEWVASQGVQADDKPVFLAPRGERLNSRYLEKLVVKAMEKAGIPKVGEGGRPRKPFHSLRATFARSCREGGADPQWLQNELGHATLDLTIGVYSEWQESAKLQEAEGVDFTV